jgi:Tfp pilus assembly protein PilF
MSSPRKVSDLLKQNKVSDAQKHVQTLLKEDPNSPEGIHGLGLVMHKQGNYKEAEAQFDKALQMPSDHAEVHKNRGQLYHDI